jgi:hypothetical protein
MRWLCFTIIVVLAYVASPFLLVWAHWVMWKQFRVFDPVETIVGFYEGLAAGAYELYVGIELYESEKPQATRRKPKK